jgi:hypothetical protein
MAGMALAAGAAAPLFGATAGQAFASELPQMAMTAAGGIFGGIAARKQQKRAHAYNLEYMDKQFEQNKEAAAINQGYAKEMWDYTSFENQRKHMEAANLNPALMYGMGGAAGGSASGSGTVGGGGSLPGTNPVSAGAQAGGMSIQGAMMFSEIAKNFAQASKDEAEAEKKKGVDTEEAKARINLINKQSEVQDEVKQLTAANYFKVLKEQEEIWQRARLLSTQADIAEKTKEAEIEGVYVKNWLNTAIGLEKLAQVELHEADAKKILEETRWIAFDMQTRRITAEAAKERINVMMKELEKKYKFQNQENIRAWIFGSIDALAKGANSVSNFIPIGRVIKVGEKVLDEVFDNKGKSKGWREITKEFTNTVE